MDDRELEDQGMGPPRRQDAKRRELFDPNKMRTAGLQQRREPSAELDKLAHDVIGAAIEVHRILGPGYLESIYEEALCIELTLRNIPFRRQVPISVFYKGHSVGGRRLD